IKDKHLTLDNLLACIPELADLYFNVTGKPPKSSPYEMKSASPMGGPKFGNQSLPDPPEDPNAADAFPLGLCYLLTSPYHQTLEDCKAMQNYFQPLDIIQRTNDGPAIRGYVLGESEEACLARIPSHQSALVPPSWFDAPFGEVKDMLAVHFLLTYHLSIIVRYRPSLWREITEGEYNDYFSLIRQYHHVFSRVVPQMVLERLEGRPVKLIALFNEVQVH
ncbi:YaaC family protein, partial [Deinococcus cellulosilyticus]|uniref:YaaC family protein n=1 Tax=Deinococcus cellulosilyticus TaxID=401558 RepID=UPI001C99B54A